MIPLFENPASSEIFSDTKTVGHGGLFLARPIDGNKCSTSKDTWDSPWGWFKIFRHQQNRNLGMDPISRVELYYPHYNIVHNRVMNFGHQTSWNVCHKLVLFWLLREQACLRTEECQVYQFEPSTNMSRQCVSKLLTSLQLIRGLLAYVDDHPSKVLNLSTSDLSLDCQFTTFFYALLRMWGFSRTGNFSVAAAEVRVWNISLFGLTVSLFVLHSRWV